MKNKLEILLLLVLFGIYGCNSIDNFKTTEAVVNSVAKKKDCQFTLQTISTTEKNGNNIIVTVQCDTNQQAFYTASLFEIIHGLRSKNVSFDHYEIRSRYDELAWEIDDKDFNKIDTIVTQAKHGLKLLESNNPTDFLSLANRDVFSISDSVFNNDIREKPIYSNTKFAGFDIIVEELNGVEQQFIRVYSVNNKLQQNAIVISPKDNLVYGLHY